MTERTVRDRFEGPLVDSARRARRRFRAFRDVSVPAPAGMFARVVDGRVVSFGVEPVGEVLLDGRHARVLDGVARTKMRWASVAATAAGAAAAASVPLWWRLRRPAT